MRQHASPIPDPWDLEDNASRRGEITVPPGIAYRKLAENCMAEAAHSSPSLRQSLIKLAGLYTRTAEAIEAETARAPDKDGGDRSDPAMFAAEVSSPA
jgi:hypothetical protein